MRSACFTAILWANAKNCMLLRMDVLVRRWLCLLLLLLVSCTPSASTIPEEITLPTLIPSATPAIDLEAAELVAMAFLDGWQRQDFAQMYRLISFNSQEAISLEDFTEIYQDTQNTATIVNVRFEPRQLFRASQRTVQLGYDVTFETNILGEFSDTGRTLTVILDSQVNEWRVAWSVADIFQELGRGARLEFSSTVPSRANIYSRDGVPLADMQGRVVEIFVIREEAPDWDTCYNTLLDVLNTTPDILDLRFRNAQANWVVEAGTIDPPTYNAQQDRLRADCNATFDSRATRRYIPTGSLMPHILGYVGFPTAEQVDDIIRQGFNAETLIGQAGIEATWDDVLRGRPGGRLLIIGADGTTLRTLAETSAQVPESLWLTIDADLQNYVLQAIGEAYAENTTFADGAPGWGRTSPGAAAIVMNVNSGEVLAMASYPYYDANAYTPYPAIGRDVADQIQEEVGNDPRTPQLNRVTQGVYPSGSIFKVVDAMAVLDTGLYTENQAYYCSGIWEYEGDVRTDWWPPGHGSVNTRTALRQSCNPFFYQTGFVLNNMDPWMLPTYARRMGLGVPTGMTDLVEDPGNIPDPDFIRETYGLTWTYSNAVNLAIGQGEIEVTPLQMARMYAAIANGGTLYVPQVVRERGILDQRTIVAEPEVSSRFDMSTEALRIVREGLCDVTSEQNGTAWHIFNLPSPSPLVDYQGGVCGKTGTAQVGGENRTPHSWFAAYAPKDDPEIVVVVLVENAGDGSAVAAPITKRILEYYFFLQD